MPALYTTARVAALAKWEDYIGALVKGGERKLLTYPPLVAASRSILLPRGADLYKASTPRSGASFKDGQ